MSCVLYALAALFFVILLGLATCLAMATGMTWFLHYDFFQAWDLMIHQELWKVWLWGFLFFGVLAGILYSRD